MNPEKARLLFCNKIAFSSLDIIGVHHFPKVELPRRGNPPAQAGGTDLTPSFFRWPGLSPIMSIFHSSFFILHSSFSILHSSFFILHSTSA
jgi:hypothetical protein